MVNTQVTFANVFAIIHRSLNDTTFNLLLQFKVYKFIYWLKGRLENVIITSSKLAR